jgi:homoserine dehydrogenase
MVHKLALIGFGVVGQGLVEILLNKPRVLIIQN